MQKCNAVLGHDPCKEGRFRMVDKWTVLGAIELDMVSRVGVDGEQEKVVIP